MTFRTRVALALVAAAAIPLVVLGVGVRREMSTRLDAQVALRTSALVEVLRADLAARTDGLRLRLRSLAEAIADDNRFRLAMRSGVPSERRWLLDWAEGAMATAGLSVLRLHDPEGRVLSSGHFRNEYDRLDPDLLAGLAGAGGHPAVIRLRAPAGEVLALAASDSFTIGGRTWYLVGGVPFDPARMTAVVPADELGVILAPAVGPVAGSVAEITLPFYDAVAGGAGAMRLVITRDPAPFRALRAGVDRWFLVALGLTLALATALALWLAARLSRPLAVLAARTSRLDLDRLDEEFVSDRDDEIGALANLLGAMTRRLRHSTRSLRDAERRAATGDLARQVNHDVKNGLVPIRHVLRHLSETATRDPSRLAQVFQERWETLESSVAYLDNLARHYGRLAPAAGSSRCDAGLLLREVARAAGTEQVVPEVRIAANLPPVRADDVALRRILENLVANAVEALDGQRGRVTLSAEALGNGSEPRVRLAVSDTGRGMTAEELDLAFRDFHTTRPTGRGLGLSVVRRLLADMGGSLTVETRPGHGSTFTVEVPVV
jgi:signal transduction histidine kinase